MPNPEGIMPSVATLAYLANVAVAVNLGAAWVFWQRRLPARLGAVATRRAGLDIGAGFAFARRSMAGPAERLGAGSIDGHKAVKFARNNDCRCGAARQAPLSPWGRSQR